MSEQTATPPAEYYSAYHDLHLTEEQMHAALQRYWRWCEEYEARPKFTAEEDIRSLREDPERVGHILTRAQIMGFKAAA